MCAIRLILVFLLIPLVSSAFVAPRDECYNITTSTTDASSLLSKAPYVFSNTSSAQQCQVTMTSWVTTTITVASSSGYLTSSGISTAATSYAPKRALLVVKRSAISTTKHASNMSSTATSSANAQSLLSEFASMYSVLSYYEYNATANSSTATAGGSFNISAMTIPSRTSSTNCTTANATSNPATCASLCQNCTTVFCYATKTIVRPTPLPSPVTTLPPIAVGNATYTPTGTYYVIDNSTLSPGGLAILVSNSTLLSLDPSGTQLVIAPLHPTAGGPGPSTYDLSPAPASTPPVTTATATYTATSNSPNAGTVIEVASATVTGPYNLPVVILPSQPLVIAGTTITPGASAVTIRETPVSLAPSSEYLVVGSSTITLAKTTISSMTTSIPTPTPTLATSLQAKVGSMIWSGIGGTEPGSSATSASTTPSPLATFTGSNATYVGQVFTGKGTLSAGKPGVSLCLGIGLGLGFATGWSIVMTIVMSVLISTASTNIWAFETGWRMQL